MSNRHVMPVHRIFTRDKIGERDQEIKLGERDLSYVRGNFVVCLFLLVGALTEIFFAA
jgi:hypothetical protein